MAFKTSFDELTVDREKNQKFQCLHLVLQETFWGLVAVEIFHYLHCINVNSEIIFQTVEQK